MKSVDQVPVQALDRDEYVAAKRRTHRIVGLNPILSLAHLAIAPLSKKRFERYFPTDDSAVKSQLELTQCPERRRLLSEASGPGYFLHGICTACIVKEQVAQTLVFQRVCGFSFKFELLHLLAGIHDRCGLRTEMALPKLLITWSDDAMNGAVVFGGTRVPVQILLDCLEEGDTLDYFLTPRML